MPVTVLLAVEQIPGVTNPVDYMSRHPTDGQLQSHEELYILQIEEYVIFLCSLPLLLYNLAAGMMQRPMATVLEYVMA